MSTFGTSCILTSRTRPSAKTSAIGHLMSLTFMGMARHNLFHLFYDRDDEAIAAWPSEIPPSLKGILLGMYTVNPSF